MDVKARPLIFQDLFCSLESLVRLALHYRCSLCTCQERYLLAITAAARKSVHDILRKVIGGFGHLVARFLSSAIVKYLSVTTCGL